MQGESLDYTWKEARQDMLKGFIMALQAILGLIAFYYLIQL